MQVKATELLASQEQLNSVHTKELGPCSLTNARPKHKNNSIYVQLDVKGQSLLSFLPSLFFVHHLFFFLIPFHSIPFQLFAPPSLPSFGPFFCIQHGN